jgi:hypothetical protein
MNNERSLNDARLDRAIDRAVRELMQVDPVPGLRRRVLSRLNAPVERRAFPAMRYAFAATAALVVTVMSFTQIRSHVERPPAPKAPSLIVASGPPPIDLEAVLSRADVNGRSVSPPTDSARISKEPIPMPRITNVFSGQRSGVSAATVREPGVDGIALGALAPLTIVPLSARPIVIEPLLLPAILK